MVKGNKIFTCQEYNNLKEVKLYIDEFVKKLKNN